MESKNVGILSATSPTINNQKANAKYRNRKKSEENNNNFKDTLAQKKKMDKPKQDTKNRIYKKDTSVNRGNKKDTVEGTEDELKLLRKSAQEIKELLAEAVVPINVEENPELEQLSTLLEKLNSMLEDLKVGDELKLKEGIQLLNDIITKLTSTELGSDGDVSLISTELLELARVAKQADDIISDINKKVDFSSALQSKTREVSEIVTMSSDVSLTDSDSEDDVIAKDDDKEVSAYKSYEADNSTARTLGTKSTIKIINKAGFIDAYGNNEMQDMENFENMGDGNVKVDQNSNLIKIDQSNTVGGKDLQQVIDQITQEISVNVNEDVSEIMLKLRPDHLGKLAMRITIDRGIMVANFEVESQVVKEAIEASLDDLKSSLEDKGIAVQEFSVSVNKDDTGQEQMSRFFSNSKKQNLNKLLNEDLKDLKDIEDKTTNYEMTAMRSGIYSTVDYLA